MQHPKLDGATFASPVGAVDHYESLGWKLVTGRDKDKNLKDVRIDPGAFEGDTTPGVDTTVGATSTASTKES